MIILMLLVPTIFLVGLGVYIWDDSKWRVSIEKFRPGLYYKGYSVNGVEFKKEKLIKEYLILERRHEYVLLKDLQKGDESEPVEKRIKYLIEDVDKSQLVDFDGRIIATFTGNLFSYYDC